MSSDSVSVVILGSGGHARVLCEALGLLGVTVVGFVAPTGEGSRLGEVPWLGSDDALSDMSNSIEAVNGVGSVGVGDRRAAAHWSAVNAGLRLHTVIHPQAIVSPSAILGAGAQVLAGSIVGAGARIGVGAIVNSGAIVEHDCVVGAHSHVAPGALLAGDVTIGESSHIGLGARILQGVSVGASSVVGAGAVLLRDLADRTTAVGVPAAPSRTERNG